MGDRARLERFVKGAAQLPVLPALLSRLIQAVNDPDSTADGLARIIGNDPSLSGRLLKMANSVFYSRSGQVASVRQAIVILGTKTMQSLVVTIWTYALRHQAPGPEAAALGLTIKHCLAAAVAARLLMRRHAAPLEEEAFLAGLMHDLGRIGLLRDLGAAYLRDVVDAAAAHGVALREREESVLGFDHAELGAELMRAWHLPEFLPHTAARHHHAELSAADDSLTAAVALADAIVVGLGVSVGNDAVRVPRDGLLREFGLAGADAATAFAEECERQLDALIEALSALPG
jgi:HD-like signal output (HDOD) protein